MTSLIQDSGLFLDSWLPDIEFITQQGTAAEQKRAHDWTARAIKPEGAEEFLPEQFFDTPAARLQQHRLQIQHEWNEQDAKMEDALKKDVRSSIASSPTAQTLAQPVANNCSPMNISSVTAIPSEASCLLNMASLASVFWHEHLTESPAAFFSSSAAVTQMKLEHRHISSSFDSAANEKMVQASKTTLSSPPLKGGLYASLPFFNQVTEEKIRVVVFGSFGSLPTLQGAEKSSLLYARAGHQYMIIQPKEAMGANCEISFEGLKNSPLKGTIPIFCCGRIISFCMREENVLVNIKFKSEGKCWGSRPFLPVHQDLIPTRPYRGAFTKTKTKVKLKDKEEEARQEVVRNIEEGRRLFNIDTGWI